MKFVHPLTPIIETKKYPYARSYRTGFIDKVMDAFYVLSGGIPGNNGIPGKTDDHVFGIFDYLTLGIHFFISEKLMRLATRPPSTFVLVISVALFAVFSIPRYLFATVMTFLCLPIIGIVNLVTRAKSDEIKHNILNYLIKEEKSSLSFSECSAKTLGLVLQDECHTILEDSKWLIDKNDNNISLNNRSNILFFFNQDKHKTVINSLVQLNIDNLATRIEEENIQCCP